jgi:hypothetical protein
MILREFLANKKIDFYSLIHDSKKSIQIYLINRKNYHIKTWKEIILITKTLIIMKNMGVNI